MKQPKQTTNWTEPFLTIRWNLQDIKSALAHFNILNPPPEICMEIATAVEKKLEESSIQTGWDAIENYIFQNEKEIQALYHSENFCHKIEFRKHEVFVCQKKFPLPLGGKYVYGIRHDDNDSTRPVTVEPKVSVNRWGYLVTEHALIFGKKGFLQLKKSEQTRFIEAMTNLQRIP